MSSQFKKTMLSLAVTSATSCLVSSYVLAQDNSGAPANKAINEEVVVYGLKGSIMSAQDLKRDANTVKDVITASDIGALPDKSVTEALQRVPGVTMDRFSSSEDPNHFSSEGSGIVIRGLQRVRSEINGRDAFSAKSYGGGLSYADIPAELLGSIEVVKNQTADLIVGGVAGTVNLITRKPFDTNELTVYGQIKGTYGDHREEWTPVFTGMFSNVWETDAGKFGFLLGATDSEFKDRGDGVGLDNYYERSASAMETDYFPRDENGNPLGTSISGYEGETLYAPAGMTIRSADSNRVRTGIISSAQWADVNEKVEVTLEYIYSDAGLEWDERVIEFGQRGYEVDPSEVNVTRLEYDSSGFVTSGELYTPFLNASTRWNNTETDIHDTSLHIKFTPSDKLTIDADYQRIESENNVVDYSISSQMRPTHSWHPNGTYAPTDVVYVRDEFSPTSAASFSLENGGITNVSFPYVTTTPTLPEESFIYSTMDKEENTHAESDAFSLDLEYDLNSNWIASIETGLYASEKSQIAKDSAWNWSEVSSPWAGWWDDENATWWTLPFEGSHLYHPEYFETHTFSANNFHGGGVLDGDQSFLFPRLDMVHNFQQSIEQFESDMPHSNTAVGLANRTPANPDLPLDGKYRQSEITETTEERLELYLQSNFEFEDFTYPIRGNVGLRYISWQVESTGGRLFPEAFAWDEASNQSIGNYVAENFPDENAFANNAETAATTVRGDKYTKVLPSFNMSIGWTKDFITRLAVSENVYLPIFRNFRNYQHISKSSTYDYSQPGTSQITDINFSGISGNPYIEPEESFNVDLTAEWYFADAGSLTFSYFRKELDNIIRQRLYNEDVTNPLSDVTQPVAFQTYVNTDGGTLQGAEFAYTQFFDMLPGSWSGLGVSANYTKIEQTDINDRVGFGEGSSGDGGRNSFRTFKNLELPGYSDDTYNLALMYEKYGISARLAYSWRSDYLLTRRDADHFSPVIAKSTGQLDASLSYQVNDNVKVGMEMSNLTDEVIKTELMFEENGRQTPRNQFKTDRRFGFFVQAKY